jgi:aryl-alcohol dehydrogenase-like predicted oxidoreductase
MGPLALDHYRLLGRSGLRVSPLCLGGMGFGTEWGFGTDEATTRRIFAAYADRGGNFVDTANIYSNGTSERFLGAMLADRRHRMVVATKYSAATRPKDPNSGGNHRKSMLRAVEESLERLHTDYIDLFYLHLWDKRTPVEEILRGFDDLVRQGKILYAGISDTPAWQASRMQAIAELRGWAPLIALQIEYSLAERTVERDLIPMAQEMGMGVVPWSPLAAGILTGKHRRTGGAADSLRTDQLTSMGKLSERTLGIGDTVRQVASEMGKTAAQVALAWTLVNPAVTAPIVGIRTLEQLEDNIGALDVVFDEAHLDRLDAASRIELGFPHDMLGSQIVATTISGGACIPPR